MRHKHFAVTCGVLFCLPFLSIALSCGTGGKFSHPASDPDPAYSNDAWVSCGGPPGGLGYDIRHDFDDHQRWYVTDAFAGFFYSTDDGQNWVASNVGFEEQGSSSATPVFSATVDPHDPSIVWVGIQNSGQIYKSLDYGMSWTRSDTGVIPNSGQSFRGFTVDPLSSNTVYATSEVEAAVLRASGAMADARDGTQGGRIYRTVDGGANWELLWEGAALVRYIWIDPIATDTLYASTGFFDRVSANAPEGELTGSNCGGCGVLKSTDGGDTWVELGQANGLEYLQISSLYMKPGAPDTLLAGAGSMSCPFDTVGDDDIIAGGAYLTTDGGATWAAVIQEDRITAVEYCENDPEIAYAASAFAVYRSADGGWTWTKYWDETRSTWGPPGISPGVPVDIQVDPDDSNRLFINNYVGGNFLSTDGGQNWAIASKGYTGADPPRIYVDPDDAGHVYTVTRMAPFESMDGGETWIPCSHSELTGGGEALGMEPSDAQHLLIDSGQCIFQTTDGGASWTERSGITIPPGGDELDYVSIQHKEFAFAPSNTDHIYAGTLNTGINLDECEPEDVQGVGIYRSTDGGVTWTQLTDAAVAARAFVAIAVSPSDHLTVYAAGCFDVGVFKSTDGGESWTAINSGLPYPYGFFKEMVIDPSDANRIFLGGQNGLFRSVDGGASWTQLTAGLEPTATAGAIVLDPTDSQVVYCGTNGGVYYSIDGGDTFLALNQGMGGKPFVSTNLALSSDGAVLYSTSVGVYRLGAPASGSE